MTLHDTRHAGSLSGLERHQHICVFYGDRDEEYRVLGSFIADGFPHGDRAFHIIDGESRADHLRRLERLGVDVAAAERRGQLELRHWEDAHLRPGWFDQDAMLALVDDALGDSRRRGFGYTRWVANMGWALGSWRGVDDLVQYCARLNEVVPSHEATIVCTYDISNSPRPRSSTCCGPIRWQSWAGSSTRTHTLSSHRNCCVSWRTGAADRRPA